MKKKKKYLDNKSMDLDPASSKVRNSFLFSSESE